MEEIFQVIAFIVFGIFVLARRFVKKKKLADQDQESQDGGGMKLPSWLEELDCILRLLQMGWQSFQIFQQSIEVKLEICKKK